MPHLLNFPQLQHQQLLCLVETPHHFTMKPIPRFNFAGILSEGLGALAAQSQLLMLFAVKLHDVIYHISFVIPALYFQTMVCGKLLHLRSTSCYDKGTEYRMFHRYAAHEQHTGDAITYREKNPRTGSFIDK